MRCPELATHLSISYLERLRAFQMNILSANVWRVREPESCFISGSELAAQTVIRFEAALPELELERRTRRDANNVLARLR